MNFTNFDIPVLIVTLLAGAYFLLPTLLIYSQQIFRAETSAEYLSPDLQIPKLVEKQLSECRQDLQSLGFESRGILLISRMFANATALIEVFVNRYSGDVAMVNYIYGHSETKVIETIYFVEFIRRFRDSDIVLVQTNNSGRCGAFPDTPKAYTFRIPQVADVGELYKFHLKLVARQASGIKPYIRLDEEFDGNLLLYWEGTARECFEQQTRRRWLKYDSVNRYWRLTVWGAFRMTAQELPPFNRLRAMRLQAKGRQLLADLRDTA